MAKKRNPPKKPPTKPLVSPLEETGRKATEHHLDVLYGQIREILATARDRAWQAVSTVMVEAHWEVGRVIVEDEQAGKEGPVTASGSWKGSPDASRPSSARASTSPTSATCGRSS